MSDRLQLCNTEQDQSNRSAANDALFALSPSAIVWTWRLCCAGPGWRRCLVRLGCPLLLRAEGRGRRRRLLVPSAATPRRRWRSWRGSPRSACPGNRPNNNKSLILRYLLYFTKRAPGVRKRDVCVQNGNNCVVYICTLTHVNSF